MEPRNIHAPVFEQLAAGPEADALPSVVDHQGVARAPLETRPLVLLRSHLAGTVARSPGGHRWRPE